jgi:pimeloyl-ACP methyl ester carboxylesterase
MDRRDVSFDSSGTRCAAWLYGAGGSGADGGPDGPGGAGGPGEPDAPERRPCVVLAHGFGALRTARLDAYAERFAAAGLAALAFDYRHFGDSAGEPRQLLDVARQLDDWRAAIRFARSLDGVDPERIVLWGTSFSGGHVAVLAAEDGRVAAAISQAPFADGVAALRSAGPADAARMTVAGVRDAIARLRGRPPFMIPIVGPPGHTAVMNSPDAEPGYRAMFPPGAGFRNEVAARITLRVGFYRPFRAAPRIECPWLVCVADGDAVTPPQPALKWAGRAPRAELRRYDCGHFDIYRGEPFERAVADQIDFLARHGLATPAPAAVTQPLATPQRPAGPPGR